MKKTADQCGTVKERILNGHTPIVAKVLFWIIGLTAAAATAWALNRVAVTQNTARLDDNVVEIKELDARVHENSEFCVEQRNENRWQRATLTRIEAKLDK